MSADKPLARIAGEGAERSEAGEGDAAAAWEEWHIPREAGADWPDEAKKLLTEWWAARIARQKEIDASIAAKAELEYLYDKPYPDNSRTRVAGPFTVESLSPHRVMAVDEDDSLIDTIDLAEPGGGWNDFAQMVLENLKTSGVQRSASMCAVGPMRCASTTGPRTRSALRPIGYCRPQWPTSTAMPKIAAAPCRCSTAHPRQSRPSTTRNKRSMLSPNGPPLGLERALSPTRSAYSSARPASFAAPGTQSKEPVFRRSNSPTGSRSRRARSRSA
jgi:hypothetical protein